MPGPLENIKIIEMSGIGPCPLAGQLLADLGAQVTVIDRTSGIDFSKDVNRRGKKSIALNLKTPRGVELARQMIDCSDVLIEGFRPGVMERLGLGPQDCFQSNPGLVFGRITGWGQTGPLSQTAGHDLNYFATTGFLHAIGKKEEPPLPPLNFAADYGGGSMFLIMGVLSALIERGVSGKGQVIDAAMVDGVPAMMGLIQTLLAQDLWTKNRSDNFLDGGAPYYRCYACKDGKFLSVGCIEPQFFAEFLKLAGLDEALTKQQNDKSFWPEMHLLFEKTIAKKSRDEWTEIFAGSDACVAPVLNFDEAQKFHHYTDRQSFVPDTEVWQTMPAPRFSRTISKSPQPAAVSGSDSAKILEDLGLSDHEITTLAKNGVIL